MRSASQDEAGIPPALPGVTMTHSRTESALLPPSLQLNTQYQQPRTPEVISPSPPKVPGKGVSSLIEMYREREKVSIAPVPSKLPVRTTSLSAPKLQPEPPSPTPPEDEDPFVGRVSPGAPRYSSQSGLSTCQKPVE